MVLAVLSPVGSIKRLHLSDSKQQEATPAPQADMAGLTAGTSSLRIPFLCLHGGLASCRWNFHEGGWPAPSFAQLSAFQGPHLLIQKEITNGNYYNLQKV